MNATRLSSVMIFTLVELVEKGPATFQIYRRGSAAFYLRAGSGKRISWKTFDALIARGYVTINHGTAGMQPTPEGVHAVQGRL